MELSMQWGEKQGGGGCLVPYSDSTPTPPPSDGTTGLVW